VNATVPVASETYPATPRTVPTRLRERVSFDPDELHAVLDEALICHLGLVVDGEPLVLPTIHARVGRVLYLHGSTGSRLARMVGDQGLPVCVTVTLVDGLVLARSQFHHSMNYRSVVIRGRAYLVTDPDEVDLALAAVVEHVVPGRSSASRPAAPRELAATAVLRVPLEEASLKRRSGPPADDPEDLALPHWAGVVPVRTAFGVPQEAPDLAPGLPAPEHVTAYTRP
jgi:nitroimidazol reductase NimA-like FMN-containing flavoprotein (pyridoxamine 5'-phosphate oxidase superfamily)